MNKPNRSTVADHLLAIDESVESWIVALGELIQETLSCDPAMAASRARDLCRQEILAQGLQQYISGWMILKGAHLQGLTPLQKSTLQNVLEAIREEAMKLCN